MFNLFKFTKNCAFFQQKKAFYLQEGKRGITWGDKRGMRDQLERENERREGLLAEEDMNKLSLRERGRKGMARLSE